MTDAPETCPDCGTPLVYAGPPIHEEYCPNKKCDREKRLMKESIQMIRKALSRRGYLRGLEDAARVADEYKERADARANVTRGVGKHDATKGHEGQSSAAVSIAAAIRALAEKERQCLKSP